MEGDKINKALQKIYYGRIGVGLYSIPKKCFDSQEQFEEFGRQLFERWKASK